MARPKGEPITTWVDDNDPKSISYLLRGAPSFLAAVKGISPFTLEKSERQLEQEVRKKNKGEFPRQLGNVKIRFWEEYREAQTQGRMMRMEDIKFGMCQDPWWQKHVLRDEIHLAWLIHPPVDELVLQKEIIQLAHSKLRDVFDAEIFITEIKPTLKKNREGVMERQEILVKRVNLPLVREIHGILKTMQDRVHGSVLQRTKSETTSKNLNIHAHAGTQHVNPGAPRSISSPDISMIEIQEFQRELTKTMKLLEASARAQGDTIEEKETLELEAEYAPVPNPTTPEK